MHLQSAKHGSGWWKSIRQHISLHHVHPKGCSTHYYAIHSCPICLWTRCNNKSMSWCRQRNNQEIKTRPYQQRQQTRKCNGINYMYKQGDKVLLKNAWKTKFNWDAYLGPFVIIRIRNNGTVRAHKGRVIDIFAQHPKSNFLQGIRFSPPWSCMTYRAEGSAKYSQ